MDGMVTVSISRIASHGGEGRLRDTEKGVRGDIFMQEAINID
jgi:hypothetical protein